MKARRYLRAVNVFVCAPTVKFSGGAMMSSTVQGQSMSRQSGGSPAKRIAFIQACWHRDIVDQSRLAFSKELEKEGYGPRTVDCFEVPGAFEIPLQAKLLAETGRYAAIVGTGFVVDGGIYRHEFVAASVIDALMSVQLETEVPIISLVMTPLRFHEHDEHRAFFRRHFLTKGREAAIACAATINNIRTCRKLKS